MLALKTFLACAVVAGHCLLPQQTSRIFYQELSWSPDGSRILFSGFHDNQADIYVMNADAQF